MQHNDDGFGYGSFGVHRTQRSPRQEDHPTRHHADEASGCRRSPEREAHRAAVSQKLPPVRVDEILKRLPNAILTHLSIDDVCRETMLLVNLLDTNSVEFA